MSSPITNQDIEWHMKALITTISAEDKVAVLGIVPGLDIPTVCSMLQLACQINDEANIFCGIHFIATCHHDRLALTY